MDLFLIAIQLGGGLVLFLFSIQMLSNTLKKVASGSLKTILQKVTSNPIKGVFIGTTVTFLVQSSSVTILLLIGLVNAGIMSLRQAIYIILGSGIGTTITAQIVAFKVKLIFYPLMVIGFAMSQLCTKEKSRYIGDILLYLGMIFLAMKIMSDGSKPLAEYPQVLNIITNLGVYPLLGILIGATLTAITSSSSATTSLVIAMSIEGIIPLSSGIALILGANIGTCVLELVAVIGMGTAAIKTSFAQLLVNIIGTMCFYPLLDQYAHFISLTAVEMPRLIANAHTIFNITVSFCLIPFVGLMIILLDKIVPAREKNIELSFGHLENKFLTVPALALYEAEQEVNRMASVVNESLKHTGKAVFENNNDSARLVIENERHIDDMYEKVGNYLNRISTVMLNETDRAKKRSLVHTITDLERIADISENIVNYLRVEHAVFSENAKKDLAVIFNNAVEVYITAAELIQSRKKVLNLDFSTIEDKTTRLKTEYRNKYIHMLEKDSSRPVVDAYYPYILKDIGRISDHANNIAEHIIKT